MSHWFNPTPVNERIKAALVARLATAGTHLVGAVQASIDIACPAYAVRKAANWMGRKGKNAANAQHAPAGAPPYRETGRLKASITMRVDPARATVSVGTNVPYAPTLELGRHPFLRRALHEQQNQLATILTGK